MTEEIFSPPPPAFLNVDNMTLTGIITDELVVTVPKGLYYAPGSIILRHKNAVLIMESGVRIMFAEHASIRVDHGVLRVLGEVDDPVELTPTQNLTAEYTNSNVSVSTVFRGMYFGPNSNGTELSEEDEYIGGSLLRNCIVRYMGYYYSPDSSIRLDRASVMLKNVTIEGDRSKSVKGIHINNPTTPVLIDRVGVHEAGKYGVYIESAQKKVTLTDVSVHNSGSYGVFISYPRDKVTLADVSVHNSGSDGMYFYNPSDRVALIDVLVHGSRNNGVGFYGNSYSSTLISGSQFHDNQGSSVYVSDYRGKSVNSTWYVLFESVSHHFFLAKGTGNFTIDSSFISNTTDRGVYMYKPDAYISITNSYFTGVKIPMYISASKVNVAFSRFHHNHCDSCTSSTIKAVQSILFHDNRVIDNSANQILMIRSDEYRNNDFNVSIIGNIFRNNTVPDS